MRRIMVLLAVMLAACGEGAATSVPLPDPPRLASLSVGLANAAITPFEVTTATVSGADQRGQPFRSDGAAWSSSNPAVATVTGDGIVRGVSVGTAEIRATVGALQGSATVSVAPVPVARVRVLLFVDTLREGATATATATALDSRGIPLPDRTITWASATPSVATVTQSGVITGVAAGAALITASSGGVTESVSIPVARVPVQNVSIVGIGNMKVGDEYPMRATALGPDGFPLPNRAVTVRVADTSTAEIVGGTVRAKKAGEVVFAATIEGRSFTVRGRAYDWRSFVLASNPNISLAADTETSTIFGARVAPLLSISCVQFPGTPIASTYSLGVGFSPLISANGGIVYAFDGDEAISETWREQPPSFGGLSLPTLTASEARSRFLNRIMTARTLRVTFFEYLGGAHQVTFRVTGAQSAMAPLLALCGG
jgi:hypothetical protein